MTDTAVPRTYNFKPVVLIQLHAVGSNGTCDQQPSEITLAHLRYLPETRPASGMDADDSKGESVDERYVRRLAASCAQMRYARTKSRHTAQLIYLFHTI